MIMGNRLREDADVTPSPLAGDAPPAAARRQQRWDEIVAAAERIFLRKGYGARRFAIYLGRNVSG